MSAPGRLSVGIVGAGRVGAVLGNALRAVGHDVVATSGGSEQTLERIDALLPGVPVLDPVEVARAADLVLVCVPDDDLAAVVSWIAAQGGFRSGQLLVHTSGRFGCDVLAPAVTRGAIPLAIHPAMTFTGTSLDLARLVGAPFAVTAPAPVQPIGQALVIELGGEPVLLPETARPLYHAALTHASNHLVTLIAQSRAVLDTLGAHAPSAAEGHDGAARLLDPLTHAALDGALAVGGAALTGPVSRGDAGTLAEHLRALEESEAIPAAVAVTYRALADATAQLAAAEGRITAETAAQVRRLVGPEAADHAGALRGRGALRGSGGLGRSDGSGVPVVRTVAELRALRRRMAGLVAVVPTMGALHEGHLALVRAARQAADHVVVTVFVNPTQFTDASDLAAYPRTLEADVAALAALGSLAPDVVFAPTAEEMYPRGATQITVDPGPVASQLEGAARPGHFAGVLTVVAKLLHLVQPDVAVFGQKDAQQLALIRAMAADLDWPAWILAVPVVRDGDGLALSSRNARLSAQGRIEALALSRAVAAAQRLAGAGASLAQVREAARAEVADLDVDYVELVTSQFAPATEVDDAQIVLAARVEGVRLLDTGPLLTGPSVESPGD